MHRFQFPACTVEGSFAPEPFSHLLSGAVPRKCFACEHLFEGACRRVDGRHLQLDHGPCGVTGSTKPLRIISEYFEAKADVPTKCSHCPKLAVSRIQGFYCGLDPQIWGAFPRSLDWGGWDPSRPSIEIDGREVTRDFVEASIAKEDTKAIVAFRRANPNTSINEAKRAISMLQELIERDTARGREQSLCAGGQGTSLREDP